MIDNPPPCPDRRRSGRYLVSVISLLVLLTACGQSSDDDAATPADDQASTDDDTTSSDDDTDDNTDNDTDDGTGDTTPDDGTEDPAPESSSTTEPTTTTSSPRTSTTIDKSTTTGASNPPSGKEPDYDPGLKPLVDQARSDLVGRLGVGSDQAVLVLAELRTWPDSSNGCPQEGMQYLQVLTDGAEIIFDVDGTQYRYTTGGQVFTPQLCES